MNEGARSTTAHVHQHGTLLLEAKIVHTYSAVRINVCMYGFVRFRPIY